VIAAGWRALLAGAAALLLAVSPATAQDQPPVEEHPGISHPGISHPSVSTARSLKVFDALLVYPAPPWVAEAPDRSRASARFPLQRDTSYSLEEIPAAETPQTWTRMLKVSGYRAPDVPRFTLPQAVNLFATPYTAGCDRGNASQQLLREEATAGLVGILCGNSARGRKLAGYGDGVGEVVVAKLFIVGATIVAVQFSWRGPKFDQARPETFPVPAATIAETARWLDESVQAAASP